MNILFLFGLNIYIITSVFLVPQRTSKFLAWKSVQLEQDTSYL